MSSDDVTLSSLGRRIAEERKRLALSQDRLAGMAGVARETWNRYEAGRMKPGAEVLTALARSGADVGYVLTGERPAPPTHSGGPVETGSGAVQLTAEEAALVDNFRHASEEGRRAIEAASAALAKPVIEKPAA